VSELPDFANPPVIEVACGVQFRPIAGLRGMALAPLYNQWRERFPTVQEQPPLPPMEASTVGGPGVQIFLGNSPDVRLWFIDESGREVIQIQQDRLIVNWREGEPRGRYPRYNSVRDNLESRLSDLSNFVTQENLGKLEISHGEVSYINAIDAPEEDFGALDKILVGWPKFADHHLGNPKAARVSLDFSVPDVGEMTSLRVSLGPGGRSSGEISMFMTMTVEGRTDGASSDAALAFIDAAHDHLVRSFAEITTAAQHESWGRRS